MKHKTIPLPIKHNQQVQEYLDAVAKKNIYIMPLNGKWRLMRTHDQSIEFFNTKEETLKLAEKELIGTDNKIFIFNKDCDLVDYIPRNNN